MASGSTSYLSLADSLEGELSGLPAGHRLPSEHELAALHAVSRITTRAALQELERRHVVRRTKGSGTFVALRIPYPIRAGMQPSWSATVAAAGHEPSYEVLAVDHLRAPAAVGRALLVPRGRAVVRIMRLGRIDGEVASHQTIWLPAALVPGIEHDVVDHRSLSAILTDVHGLRPRRWSSQAELAPVPAGIGPLLDLVGRPPVWHVESVNTCAERRVPVELNESWTRADCVRVRLELGPADTDRERAR